MKRYYPINMDITCKRCLVVGGGSIALRKVQSLIECDAQVDVVTPEAHETLAAYAEAGAIRLISRGFEPADVEGAVLVIGATDDMGVNTAVHDEAARRGIPVNIVDQPDLCEFIVPAVSRQGRVTFAISTGGGSPALSRWIKEQLEEQFGEWLPELAEILADVRDDIKAQRATFKERLAVWDEILYSDVPDLVKSGRTQEARERIQACISSPSA